MNKFYSSFCNLFHKMPILASEDDVTFIDSLKEGIIFIDKDNHVFRTIPKENFEIASTLFGSTNKMWNRSFYRNYQDIFGMNKFDYYYNQMVHYFLNYNFGINFIPVEDIFGEDNFFNLNSCTVIQIIEDNEVDSIIKDFLKKVSAPKKEHLEDIKNILSVKICINEIKSFEIKALAYKHFNIIPSDPQDFLRFLIFEATEGKETLLIKNNDLIRKLKNARNKDNIYKYFIKTDLRRLSSIFYRYKPLFLAFKKYPNCGFYINKLRRFAKFYHEPVNGLTVSNISNLIFENKIDEAIEVLGKASGRDLIKLYNYCHLKLTKNSNVNVYNIRNNKLYIKDDDKANKNINSLLFMVKMALKQKYQNKLKDKLFYIPSHINYSAPTSEKLFIGNIPYGSSVALKNETGFSAGIYWENYNGQRVDLDLHMQSKYKSYGWNSSYRNSDGDILFTGDIVNAPEGAVESYYFSNKNCENHILTISNFTGIPQNVPFKFFITEKNIKTSQDGVMNIKQGLIPPINLSFNDKNSISLGMFTKDKFIFYGGNLTDMVVPKHDLYVKYIDALTDRISSFISIEEIIKTANGLVIRNEDFKYLTDAVKEKVIDLSPENLNFMTLFDIVDCGDC